jgi:osmotically-inducible protein OsmY
VCERLWRDPRVDVSDVSVEVSDAVVTLEGSVPDRQMKHAIEDIAASCRGVMEVENRIRVARDNA